jgi:DNA-binding MarR family transcriptional regulator
LGWSVCSDPGQSQQLLADRLRVLPSKLVTVVDELERRGLVQRQRAVIDRRRYALLLTDQACSWPADGERWQWSTRLI